MTDVRVLVGERFAGSGCALADGTVVTAHHVVRGRQPGDLTVEVDGGRVGVSGVEGDEGLDVAVLRAQRPLASRVRFGVARTGDGWVVTTGPWGNDPQLGGTVSALARDVANAGGRPVTVLQLDVDQVLDDYGGYSGSAVRLAGRPDVAIGVLCEQVQSRLNTPGGGRPRATNVLYAVPAAVVARRFGLDVGDPGLRRAAEHAAAGEFDRAEAALARVPDIAGYWYLRARIAHARGNDVTALAYLDEVFRLEARHAAAIALRLRLLLLGNGSRERAEAIALAARSGGVSGPLDRWLHCLRTHEMVGAGIRSATELDARCPAPGTDRDDDWLGEGWG